MLLMNIEQNQSYIGNYQKTANEASALLQKQPEMLHICCRLQLVKSTVTGYKSHTERSRSTVELWLSR